MLLIIAFHFAYGAQAVVCYLCLMYLHGNLVELLLRLHVHEFPRVLGFCPRDLASMS